MKKIYSWYFLFSLLFSGAFLPGFSQNTNYCGNVHSQINEATSGTTTLYKQFKASLLAYTSLGLSLADGNTTVYDSAFSNNIDNDDVTKQNNFGENFGILRNGVTLAIEARMPIVLKDSIFYKIWNLKQQQYRLQFVPKNMNLPGLTAILQDNFLVINTPLSVVDTTNFDFFVTTNTASSATDRFRIIFKVSSVMPVTFTGIKAKEIEGRVRVDWNVAGEKNIKNYLVEHSIDGIHFENIGNVNAIDFASAYTFMHQQPNRGDNFYRINAIELSGNEIHSSIVKVNLDKKIINFIVSPNPVTNKTLNLQFNNQPKGKYQLRLSGINGQIILIKTFDLEEGNYTKSFSYPSDIAPGVYHLEIIMPNGFKNNIQQIVINN